MGILVQGGSTVNADFGNTTLNGGSGGISLQSNSGGTRTFGTLSITNGSGAAFANILGGGLTNVTGTTTITNPGGRGIEIGNTTAGNGVTFADVTITSPVV
ncbi:MAG: hypothetical protein IPL27_00490 [Lewinellaceae bacterium]|nr:hypothetical protein [Lewinellaceae bacterium]